MKPVQTRTKVDLSTFALGTVLYLFLDLAPLSELLGIESQKTSELFTLCSGALSGVVLWCVSPSTAVHASLATFLVLWAKMFLDLAILTNSLYGISTQEGHEFVKSLPRILVSEFGHQMMWMAGALGAVYLMKKLFTHYHRQTPVVFPGFGEASEPSPRPRVALFFMLVFFAGLFSAALGAITELREVKTGLTTSDEQTALMVSGVGVTTFWFAWKALLGGSFLGLAKRCYPRSAIRTLLTPGSSFLWLRPFDVDGLPQGVPSRTDLVTDTWRSLMGRTFEERIDRCFNGFSGLVAIGRPGERLPPSGAARLYVENDQWQSIVSGLMQHCSGTILHVASSEGTLWEWKTAPSLQRLSKLILCIPVRGTSKRVCRRKYAAIKTLVEHETPIRLPEKWNGSLFAYFPSDRTYQASWVTRGKQNYSAHPLKVVLERLARVRFRWASSGPMSVVFLFILFAIAAYLRYITR